MTQVTNADSLSVVGMYLTLIGLIGSFFYIHLGEWYRDIKALVVVWDLCKSGGTSAQKEEIRRCKGELSRLAVSSILPTLLPVLIFVFLISYLAFALGMSVPQRSAEWVYVGVAWLLFLTIFLGTVLLLVTTGWIRLAHMKKEMFPPKDD